MKIEFGDWTPDAGPQSAGVIEALNVLPGEEGYITYNASVPDGDALAARCQGLFHAKAADGTVYTYACTGAEIYSRSGLTWTQITGGPYTTDPADFWTALQWDEALILTNNREPIQALTLGDAATTDLSADAPLASAMDRVQQFLVVGDTEDLTDGHVPYRVRWSGFNDPSSWVVAVDTGADFQDLNSTYGAVKAVIGGEYGTVFQERAITRLTYAGHGPGRVTFERDEVERGPGLWGPNSAIKTGSFVGFLSEDGFRIWDGAGSTQIGAGEIDRWFNRNLDTSGAYLVQGGYDPARTMLWWIWPSNASSQNCDKALVFNYGSAPKKRRWTVVDLDAETVGTIVQPAWTLEDFDVYGALEDIPYSLDSAYWQSSGSAISIMDHAHRLARMNGAPVTGEITSREVQATAGISHVGRVRPLIESDSASVTVAVGSRDSMAETVRWGRDAPMLADGACCARSRGRYHRAKAKIPGEAFPMVGVELAQANGRGWR